ncbi:unnamed protein product [Linum tenue]|uniref:Uncharacterized protein n=1 Tax=Linum tenue TaxID=586396 RepID=A0AAV0N7T6_9ROSI|nr:unnamed protein product [Linum tenue]
MKVMKREPGLLRMEGVKGGRKGLLTIDAEIFEVAPNFHLVEVKKSNGDTMEFRRVKRNHPSSRKKHSIFHRHSNSNSRCSNDTVTRIAQQLTLVLW